MSETTQFVRACALADVPGEGALGLEIEGLPVAVVRTGGMRLGIMMARPKCATV